MREISPHTVGLSRSCTLLFTMLFDVKQMKHKNGP
jgi:hypothetical protein